MPTYPTCNKSPTSLDQTKTISFFLQVQIKAFFCAVHPKSFYKPQMQNGVISFLKGMWRGAFSITESPRLMRILGLEKKPRYAKFVLRKIRVHYGNISCVVFKGGTQNQKGFWLEINCIILKIVKILTKLKKPLIKEQFTKNAPPEMFLILSVVPSLGYGRVLITNLQVICNVHTILHRS